MKINQHCMHRTVYNFFTLRVFIYIIFLLPGLNVFAQDCTEVQSYRQVLNTHDYCGDWCADTDYVFTLGQDNCYVAGDDLTFIEYHDGTATLEGSVIQDGNVGQVSVTFSDRTSVAPDGSPKYMLCISSGGEDWYYYPTFTGTFTYPNGTTTTITRKGPAFQIGYGANLQDSEYGGSGWFYTSDGGEGDFNFQLADSIFCTENDYYLDVECAEVGSDFNFVLDENAAGGAYVTVQDGNNAYASAPSGINSRVRFNLTVSQSGDYYIFARVQAPSSNDDSFWVRVNDGNWVKWNQIASSDSFIWDQVHDNNNANTPVAFPLTAGFNTIDFAYREDGTLLDKIFVSLNNQAPIGGGFDAINCAESECIGGLNITVEQAVCTGDTSMVTVEVVGGTAPYTYAWSHGPTTAVVGDLEAGIYGVTVTDAAGCSWIAEVQIDAVIDLEVICTVSQGCPGEGNAYIVAEVTGGQGGYQYHWSNTACDYYIDGLSPGIYSLTVVDGSGCTATCSATIIDPEPIIVDCQASLPCDGDGTGTLTGQVSGGTPPYQYAWSTLAETETVSGVAPGTYSLTITDGNDCTASCSVVLEPSDPIIVTVSAPPGDCIGQNTSATPFVVGGTPPYTYLWSNGATSATIENILPGTYILTVTDADNCTGMCTAIVEGPDPIELTCSATATDCTGNSGGTAAVAATGGNGNYTYQWSNGASSANLTDIAGGIYTVTVTDGNACTAVCEVTVEVPAQLEIETLVVQPICTGGSGSVGTTIIGGTAPYTYQWSNGATTSSVTGLAAGNYDLTVTDANGCVATASIVIEMPATIEVICNSTDASCVDNSDGSIMLQVTGGTGAYTYEWSNGATTDNLFDLLSGNYSVTVTDINGCSAICEALVNAPIGMEVLMTSAQPDCAGGVGAITVEVSDGTAPFSYVWNNGATTATLDNLSEGSYSLSVTDAAGCTAMASASIEAPAALQLSCTPSQPSCVGASDGGITTQATGGTGSYTYAWNTGATTASLTNLLSDTYSLTVTDENGCSAVCSTTITNPEALVLSCSANQPDCGSPNSGSVVLEINGGTAPYTYLWNTGATTQNIDLLSEGIYSVTVTDANGCSTTCSTMLEATSSMSIATVPTHLVCGVEQNGTVDLTVTGGSTPYAFNWSNGATTEDLQDLAAGDFAVTVTDANGCTAASITTVQSPPELIVISSATVLDCFGASNATAYVDVVGGIPPYVYLWATGDTTEVVEAVGEGVYGVTVTDATGCTGVCTAYIDNPEELVVESMPTAVNCSGETNGAISAFANGGSGSYTYLWNTGAIIPELNNLAAGEYTLTVTDGNGCEVISTTTLVDPAPVTIELLAEEPACASDLGGTIEALAQGGTGELSYTWNNGMTTPNLSDLGAGNYSLTVSDANGCFSVKSISISEPVALSASCIPVDLECAEPNTGQVDLTVSGGTGAYTFAWNNGASTEDLSAVDAGNYEVTVTDANGCSVIAGASVISAAPLQVICTANDLDCGQPNTGSVSLDVSGGVGNYTYAWNNGATTAFLTGLGTGTYTVTVTDSNNCTTTCSTEVKATTPVAVNCTAVDQQCGIPFSGNISISVSGGDGAYTYNWSNGTSNANLSNVEPGTYSVTVTDGNGCTTSCSAAVSATTDVEASCEARPLDCGQANTGSIDLTVSGGNGTYNFLWSNGANTEDLEGLGAGLYSVTVFDTNGCVAICNSVVTTAGILEVTLDTDNIYCGVPNTGVINAEVNNGTPPYTYAWSNGADTQKLTDLAAGTYTLTVTDANGCIVVASSTVESTLGLNVSCTAADTQCGEEDTGGVDLTVTGGTGIYSFQWSNGAITEDLSNVGSGTYAVTVTDDNGCSGVCISTVASSDPLTADCESIQLQCGEPNTGEIDLTVGGGSGEYSFEWNNGETTEDLVNIGPGSYEVTVTDANGCTTTCSTSISESNAMSVSCVPSSLQCRNDNSGSIDVTPNGGDAPYTYAWSNGMTTEDISNLAAGNYTVTVTDANGCTSTCSANVTQPGYLIGISSSNNISCNGANDGSAFVTTIGGTSPYTYAWNTGATTLFIGGLSVGTYTVTITDANGCNTISSTSITEPSPLLAECVAQNNSCDTSGGGVNLAISGGTAPFEFLWSNGQGTQNLTGLSSGTYSVTVTDANGCSAVCSTTLDINEPLAIDLVASDLVCGDNNSGSIDLTPSGGSGTYFYQWSHGPQTQDVSNLSAGSYDVTLFDDNGCNQTATIEVIPAPALTIVVDAQDVDCRGNASGSATANVVEAGGPYTFVWSSGDTTKTANGLAAGNYGVTVTDIDGCFGTATVTIDEPGHLIAVSSGTPISCFGDTDGTAFVTAFGGTPPYQYNWNNGSTSIFLNALVAGNYEVTVTDANGCQTISSTTVESPDLLTVGCNAVQPDCSGITQGSISLNVNGGTAPYSYLWNNGGITPEQAGLSAGEYSVTVTDANGCSTTCSTTIQQPGNLSVTCLADNIDCAGGLADIIIVDITEGLQPYTYEWSDGSTDPILTNVPEGVYSVTVTDALGCKASCSTTVVEPEPLIATYGATPVSCHGDNDGTASAQASGGTPPYQYSWTTGGTTSTLTDLAPGAYGLTITDANGCEFICGMRVGEPEPLTCSVNVIQEGSGTSTQLEVLAEGGTAPYLYSVDAGQTFTASNWFDALTPGIYTIVSEDANGCQSVCDTVTIYENLGGEADQNQKLLLSPVPVKEEVTVTYDVKVSGEAIITLQNLNGKGIYRTVQYAENGDNRLQINTTDLPSGSYVIAIVTASGVMTKQFYKD